MSLLSTFLLAFSMSSDAFVASLSKGATLHRPRFSEALRTGIIFGVVEALTPLIGWTLGLSMAQYVAAWDHWIAFTLLLLLGGHMILEGLKRDDDTPPVKTTRHSFLRLTVTAFSTSIDALAIGVGLAFMEDVHILWTALAIGLATLLMTTLGVMLGRVLGTLVGKRTEIVGGVILIGIGSTILIEHLGLFA
ncbi:manganese efflux pump MntP [Modicisalibacter xianhensis]|uniref:Putative manganese efflux pump MntP n=1 Tax=Modicisalibacter xianhensis TaxID=442341 RepID=A0A1I2YTN1_9GAMM|nr:manganese efflux pump MntP [Halomonas xianhensis]TDX31565.1 putative Mn2+ efflux pump MntP [Halomonas xianhensis]SFH28835.1 Putative Mn2+ efflux pump MntP [Halomonas xianhensis]